MLDEKRKEKQQHSIKFRSDGVVKRLDSGASVGADPSLPLTSILTLARNLTSLCFSCLLCKVGIIIAPISHVVLKSRWSNLCKRVKRVLGSSQVLYTWAVVLARRLRFKSQPHQWLAVWPWVRYQYFWACASASKMRLLTSYLTVLLRRLGGIVCVRCLTL